MFCDSSVVMPTTPPPRSPARIPCFCVKVMFVVGHGPGVPKTIPPPPPPGSGGTPGSGGGGGGCPASGAPPGGVPPPPPPPPPPGGVPPPPSPPPAGETTDPGDDPPLRAHPKPTAAKNAAPYSSRPARRLPPRPMPNPHTPVDPGPCSLASCAPALEMSSADGSTGCFGTRVPVPGTRVPKNRGSEYRVWRQVFSTTYRPGSVESDHVGTRRSRVDTAGPAGYIGRPRRGPQPRPIDLGH